MGIYVKFTKTTHQIWSCHVTLASNSKKNYFAPNSVLNFRNSYQIWGKFAQEQKSYRPKTNWGGWKTPPSAYRVKDVHRRQKMTTDFFKVLELTILVVTISISRKRTYHIKV